ncbi:hypothetical protein [Flavihumibacter fluvii]|uniref:hypothetical protein n=1 Tax=Flavihumibacter fluvii TaxID=2838157 RepID=UPI001BDF0BF9|nr:hypothetical protein [Flavihumibacter fluvii]ULQ54082.1 hypothetical protein KJS93_07085 [Flavihumibacter fluvii]
MRKIILMITCVLGSSFLLTAYGQKVGEFSYQASFPVGAFGDFVSKTSWVGFSGGGRAYVKEQLSVGGTFSWYYFPDKKGKITTQLPDDAGVYTANVTNYTNIYGLMAVVQYDLKKRTEKMVPFVRGGLGAAYQNQRQEFGLYYIQNDGVQFMMNAEAGIQFNRDRNGIVLAATYHNLPSASDMVATSFFGLKLGITAFNY